MIHSYHSSLQTEERLLTYKMIRNLEFAESCILCTCMVYGSIQRINALLIVCLLILTDTEIFMPSAKKKKKVAPTPASVEAMPIKKAPRRQKKRQGSSGGNDSPLKRKDFPLLPFAAILACTALLPQIYRFIQFGPTAITGHRYWDLRLTPLEWRELLNKGKTILTIGGPHRSGTTLVWECISKHPEITGFGSSFRSGVSFSEGVLMQEVFPQFGVATELAIKNKKEYKDRMEGVGKYALADEASVHLTESDERVTVDNFARLLNRYGAYWNLTKKVFVDKSPPAAVMSRAFQGLYNVDVERASISQQTSPTKFLFTTRHPIANAYGHHYLLGGSDIVKFDMLLQNYVKVHTYLKEDLPHLKNDPKLIKLEDFVMDPTKHLTDIFTWLEVDASPEIVTSILKSVGGDEGIRTDVNAKYRQKWCTIDAWKREKVEDRYQSIIKDLGLDYDLLGWCKDT